jgi:hypothetical protein
MSRTDCKLCLKSKKLIRAHVIPRSFWKPIRGMTDAVVIVEKTGKLKPHFSQSGIWDREILCSDCERVFGPWDAHAQSLLLSKWNDANFWLDKKGNFVAYELKNADYTRLKLFFISVLWRASVSGQPFFSRVDLGPLEASARNHILQGDAGDPDEFSVLLSGFGNIDLPFFVFEPYFNVGEDGINFCVLYLVGYKILLKVDKRPWSHKMRSFMIRPNQPCLVHYVDYRLSKERKTAAKMISSIE